MFPLSEHLEEVGAVEYPLLSGSEGSSWSLDELIAPGKLIEGVTVTAEDRTVRSTETSTAEIADRPQGPGCLPGGPGIQTGPVRGRYQIL